MSSQTPSKPTSEYLKELDENLDFLFTDNKINEPTRESFFEFIGCHQTTYKNWYRVGIQRIYWILLRFVKEIKEHKERIKILEKQLEEITKK